MELRTFTQCFTKKVNQSNTSAVACAPIHIIASFFGTCGIEALGHLNPNLTF